MFCFKFCMGRYVFLQSHNGRLYNDCMKLGHVSIYHINSINSPLPYKRPNVPGAHRRTFWRPFIHKRHPDTFSGPVPNFFSFCFRSTPLHPLSLRTSIRINMVYIWTESVHKTWYHCITSLISTSGWSSSPDFIEV